MPIPIRPVNEKSEKMEKMEVDFSFLSTQLQEKEASNNMVHVADNDAKVLMDIWLKAEKIDNETFKVNSSMNNKDIIRLKTRGLIVGGADRVKVTGKGKTVITTMALSENNEFLKQKKEKSYSEILASMDKRGKPGYRTPKYANYSSMLNININDIR